MNAKKILVALLAVVMIVGCTIGGTLAWLSATTNTVTNTFTVGDVNIDLRETVEGTEKSAKLGEVKNENFHIVPGVTQAKDPKVVVEANSENSWVFVQIKEVHNTVDGNSAVTKYVEWNIASGWTKLGDTVDGVSTYYRTENYDKTTTDVPYYVLLGDVTNTNGKVSYNGELTKADIDELGENKPQLVFKAFAVQEVDGETVDTAWAKIAETQKLS